MYANQTDTAERPHISGADLRVALRNRSPLPERPKESAPVHRQATRVNPAHAALQVKAAAPETTYRAIEGRSPRVPLQIATREAFEMLSSRGRSIPQRSGKCCRLEDSKTPEP